jgi:hypothetical protein
MAAKESGKSKRKSTPRQMKLIKERAKGKSYAEAAVTAGYSAKNARQSGYQAMEQLRGRVPDLLDKHGLSEDALIDKYLRPLLEADKTIFFQKDGRVKEERKVADGSIRHSALRTAFELHGSYAPKVYDNKGANAGGFTLILDAPRPDHSLPINVTPANGSAAPEKALPSGNGLKPDSRPTDPRPKD